MDFIIGIFKNCRTAEEKKTCIIIGMNSDDDDALFHIKQSKNACCFVSQKRHSKVMDV